MPVDCMFWKKVKKLCDVCIRVSSTFLSPPFLFFPCASLTVARSWSCIGIVKKNGPRGTERKATFLYSCFFFVFFLYRPFRHLLPFPQPPAFFFSVFCLLISPF